MAKEVLVMNEQAITANKRLGQFIHEAIRMYLRGEDRPSDPYDVASALFLMSDETLQDVCDKYTSRCANDRMGVR